MVKYNERKRARNVLARSWRTAMQSSDASHKIFQERMESMFRRKNTGGYVLKLSPQGTKMRFKSEKEANEYLAKLKEKNAKYRNNENN